MIVYLAIFEGIDEHEVIGIYTTYDLAKLAVDEESHGFFRTYYKIYGCPLNAPWKENRITPSYNGS